MHFQRAMHGGLLETLGLRPEQAVYLEASGHAGQVDFLLALHQRLPARRLKDGDLMVAIAAGVSYVWGAAMARWGPVARGGQSQSERRGGNGQK
jgi:3-oxoacyl-[acyl-carrier-protein] synthase-3